MTSASETQRYAAVLFSDIAGYSKMMGRDEAGTLRYLQEHNDIVRSCIEARGGRVIKTIGDAFMAEFESPLKAVRAAVQAQVMLQGLNAGLPRRKARNVRIGIHYGEVSDRGGDLFGDTVNIAARLEGQAPHGGICVSGEARNALSESEFKLAHLGPKPLKNIRRPVELWHLWTPGMAPWAKHWARRQALLGWLKLAAVAGILLIAGVLGIRWTRAWAEERRWELVQDSSFVGSKPKDWELLGSNLIKEGVPLSWNRYALLKKPLPPRPFKVVVDFQWRGQDASNLNVIMADKVEKILTPDPANSALRYQTLHWEGYFASTSWVLDGARRGFALGSQGPEPDREAPSASWLVDGAAVGVMKQLSFIHEDGRLRLSMDGLQREAFPRRSVGAHGLQLALVGEGPILRRVRVYLRRSERASEARDIAEDLALKGQTAVAATVYDELSERQRSSEERDRLRLVSIFLEAEAGKDPGPALERLAQQEPSTASSLRAEFLGLVKDWERGQRAALAERLRRFVERAGRHPDSASASVLLGRLELEAGRRPQAIAIALRLLQAPEGSQGWPATALLFDAIEPSGPARAERLRALSGMKLPSQAAFGIKVQQLHDAVQAIDQKAILGLLTAFEGNSGQRRDLVHELLLAEEKGTWGRAEIRSLVGALAAQGRLGRSYLMACTSFHTGGGHRPLLVEEAGRALAQSVEIPGGPAWSSPKTWCQIVPTARFSAYGSEGIPVWRVENGILSMPFDSGRSWGVGLSLPGAGGPGGTIDLHGAAALHLRLRLPQGVHFSVQLNEASANQPNMIYPKRSKGEDGEQWVHPGEVGTGRMEDYVLRLSGLGPTPFWGNQAGNGRVDLGEIRSVEIFFSGNQGKGELELQKVEFQ